MTYEYYMTLVGEAKNIPTEEQLIGEVGFPADELLDADDFLKVLHIIYTVSREDFPELVRAGELKKLTTFARKFNLPYGTAQNWWLGKRKAPAYLLQLIGYALIAEVYLCQKGEI